MAIGRLVVTGLVLLAVVVGLMLLLRALLFTVVTPRDDAAYPLVAVAQALSGPRHYDVALSVPQELDGEQLVEGRGLLVVIVSPRQTADAFDVVNATSPTDGSRVEIERRELVGADGTRWDLTGEPMEAGDPPLQRFPSVVREGVVVVDFTDPDPPR